MSKIVFCGYGQLGINCLEKLIENNYEVKYILTHKDLTNNGLDTLAKERNIPFSYDDLRNNQHSKIHSYIEDTEILVSVNYRFILEASFFSLFKYAVNIHGSLLPRYRGRTPHIWAVINGEKYTGITCHLIDEGIDTGGIIKQEKIEIESNDTGYTLLKKYEKAYAPLLLKSLDFIKQGGIPTPQNNNDASFFGKREPIMGYIDFNSSGESIVDFVRALANPYPGAYCYLANGKKIIIDNIEKTSIDIPSLKDNGIPIIQNNNYYIKCKDTFLKVIEYRI